MVLEAIKVDASLSIAPGAVREVGIDAESVEFDSGRDVRGAVFMLAENCAGHPQTNRVVTSLQSQALAVDVAKDFTEISAPLRPMFDHALASRADEAVVTQFDARRQALA